MMWQKIYAVLAFLLALIVALGYMLLDQMTTAVALLITIGYVVFVVAPLCVSVVERFRYQGRHNRQVR